MFKTIFFNRRTASLGSESITYNYKRHEKVNMNINSLVGKENYLNSMEVHLNVNARWNSVYNFVKFLVDFCHDHKLCIFGQIIPNRKAFDPLADFYVAFFSSNKSLVKSEFKKKAFFLLIQHVISFCFESSLTWRCT